MEKKKNKKTFEIIRKTEDVFTAQVEAETPTEAVALAGTVSQPCWHWTGARSEQVINVKEVKENGRTNLRRKSRTGRANAQEQARATRAEA